MGGFFLKLLFNNWTVRSTESIQNVSYIIEFQHTLWAVSHTTAAPHTIGHIHLPLFFNKLLDGDAHIAFFCALSTGNAFLLIRLYPVKAHFIQDTEGLAVGTDPPAPIAVPRNRNNKEGSEINDTHKTEKGIDHGFLI